MRKRIGRFLSSFCRGPEDNRIDRGIAIFISLVALCFLGYILCRYKYFSYVLWEDLPHTHGFFLIVSVYLMLLLLCLLAYKGFQTQRLPVQILAVFCFAAIPRLLLLLFVPYVPVGDYNSYYIMGLRFLAKDFTTLAIKITKSHLPDFVGLSWLNALTMRVFGATVDGFRLANCVYSSLSVMLLFLIGRRYSPRAGYYAACIYALYPAQLATSQTVGNPVLSLLFLLLSLYLILLSAEGKYRTLARFLFAGASGVSMLMSQYAHPSSLVPILAIAFYLLTAAIRQLRQRSAWIKTVCLFLAFLACMNGTRLICSAYFDRIGLHIDADVQQSDFYIAKIVMGLNPEVRGSYCAEDIVFCYEQPSETRLSAAAERIQERLPTFADVLALMDTKVLYTWMVRDTNFSMLLTSINDFYEPNGDVDANAALLDRFMDGFWRLRGCIQLLDFFFVALLYVAAFLGVLLRKRKGYETDLAIWLFLGFAAVFLLIETQSRYRYPAMPMLCLLAAVGIDESCRLFPKRKRKSAPAEATKTRQND